MSVSDTVELRIENEKLKSVLEKLGYCSECLKPWDHDIETPFASCGCMCREDHLEQPIQILQYIKYCIARGVDLPDHLKDKIRTMLELP